MQRFIIASNLWLLTARDAEKYGVTTDWILRGTAPKYRAELTAYEEKDFSELKALFIKLGTGALRSVAIEQLRALTKLIEEEI